MGVSRCLLRLYQLLLHVFGLNGREGLRVSSPVKETRLKETFRRFGEPETQTGVSRPTCHGAVLYDTPAFAPDTIWYIFLSCLAFD